MNRTACEVFIHNALPPGGSKKNHKFYLIWADKLQKTEDGLKKDDLDAAIELDQIHGRWPPQNIFQYHTGTKSRGGSTGHWFDEETNFARFLFSFPFGKTLPTFHSVVKQVPHSTQLEFNN